MNKIYYPVVFLKTIKVILAVSLICPDVFHAVIQ